GRGRKLSPGTSSSARGRRGRLPRRGRPRARARLRRARPGSRARRCARRRDPGSRPRQHRRLQGPAAGRVHQRPAAHRDRQDPPRRAAQARRHNHMTQETPTLRLGELTYPEVERLLADPRPKIALLPVGSTEAHGPHLPLATDSLISEAVVERAAAELAAAGHLAAALPPIHYAVTEWAQGFAGSTSLAAEV